MSDTTSSTRSAQPSPASGDSGKVRAQETPSTDGYPAAIQDDQPTIISSQPPLAPPVVGDSTHRILHGNIQPGDRLGQFELIQFVGGGGMGRVFRALDTRLQREVALKILPPEQATDAETIARFENEAQSAARLDHPNIARVYHIGEDRGLHFIAFEFIEGTNLRAWVERNGPLPLPEALGYSLQVAQALTHASAREVVHRDIKPSNVLVAPDGHVKLIDMGLARLSKENSSAADLTASGVTLGTFDYISPEQARDPRNADVRSDIYSLGCTLFFMLAGQPPFPEGTVLQKLLQHQGDAPPDVRQFRPDVPDDVARVLRRMMAKDPGQRYADPDELMADLLPLAEREGLRPLHPAGSVWAAPRPSEVSFLQRHLPWMAPIAALVCVVVALEIWGKMTAGPVDIQPSGPLVARGLAEPEPDPSGEPTLPEASPGAEQGTQVGDQPPTPPASPDTGPAADPGVEIAGAPPVEGAVPNGEPSGPVEPARPTPMVDDAADSTSLGPAAEQAGATVAGVSSAALVSVPQPDMSEGVLSGADAESAAAATTEVPSADPTVTRRGLLVVNESVDGENEYASLAAACAAAENNDVIELRFNGRRDEDPIDLANLKVTIRAGKNYQPVVRFRPKKVDGVKHRRSMLTATAGQLQMINLALELDVPGDVEADKWSLLALHGSQQVRLEKCSLTIRNTSEQGVARANKAAFFGADTAPDASGVLAVPSEARAATIIDLTDCIARGEADFLRVDDLQPVKLDWSNGLLATTERLVTVAPGQKSPHPDEKVEILLRHVTALLRRGLLRTSETESMPNQLGIKFTCVDNIVLLDADAALIEQVGRTSEKDPRRRIEFTGNYNFYEDFAFFWILRGVEAGDPLEPPMPFLDWQTHWPDSEGKSELEEVLWAGLPEQSRPVHLHTPIDYALSDSTSNNLAHEGASDGRDAGFDAELLPPLPPVPAVVQPVGEKTAVP